MNGLPQVKDFPALLHQYSWDANHAAFGWPPDTLANGFAWIVSLEERFAEAVERKDLPVQFTAELILWGGNQNNILRNFSRGIRDSNEYDILSRRVIDRLNNSSEAIQAALAFRGFGLAYASKLLRFCRPSMYGALDGRIRTQLAGNLPVIRDGNVILMQRGYLAFIRIIDSYKQALREHAVARPSYGSRGSSLHWTAAEVEMTLFAWATQQEEQLE
jgi:hypothetical protein